MRRGMQWRFIILAKRPFIPDLQGYLIAEVLRKGPVRSFASRPLLQKPTTSDFQSTCLKD
jgi:hypothetical protein